jgi:hypothetical protein
MDFDLLNSKIDELIYDDRLHILRMILEAKVKVSTCGDGTRVWMNKLSPELTKKITEFVEEQSIVPVEHRYY